MCQLCTELKCAHGEVCGLSDDAISCSAQATGYADQLIELLQIMEKNGDEPQWISAGETVFERIWFIVEQNEGRERLEELFPHYA